ncbi:GNAT family N-acetyltransferase [Candidatus Bathyarchaeota archaeon]|nr:GNAT family N-acetyltransferase [Candidatus Bathyarchaeota archaeon]
MKCECCKEQAIYRCGTCSRMICGKHVKLRMICSTCTKKNTLRYVITGDITDEERKEIQELVKRFWGEPEQWTFDRKFKVATLPAYVAKTKDAIAGFVSFAETDDNIIIVALGVLPEYQNSGAGRALIKEVEGYAKRLGKRKLLVSTSNDDLPAVAFYQFLDFQIFEVKPNVIAKKHGEIVKGICGLPVRDELRMRKILQ